MDIQDTFHGRHVANIALTFARKRRKVLFLIGPLVIVMGVSKSKGQDTNSAATAASSISAPIEFVQVDSIKIAYKEIGNGAPIIFLARFRGTLNDWDPAFVDAVAKSYRVILFDAPGVGRSNGIVPTSVTKWADQAVQFTHTLGIRHAVFLGWSM